MSMYAVMIVDDERLIRDGLKESIKWEQFGFYIAATATDGVDALEKFRSVRPQVIIMDIKMPEMDGLRALELIKEEDTNTEVVLLSGFDEFAYAKSGIRLGAFDYVLKINVFQELEDVLSRLQKHLDEKRHRSSNLIQFEQLKSNYLFLRFIRGKMPIGIAISSQETIYSVVSIWLEKEDIDVSTRIAAAIPDLPHVMGAESHYVHLIVYHEGEDYETHVDRVSKGIGALELILQNECNGSRYAIGIGTAKFAVSDLPDSYREAMKTLDYLRYQAGSRVKMFYTEWTTDAVYERSPLETSEAWVNWVYSGDESRLLAWISELFERSSVAKEIQLKEVQTVCLQLLLQFESAMRLSEHNSNDVANFFEEMKEYDSLIELEQYMILRCKQLCSLVHENNQMLKIKSISLVKEYIDQRYTSPLSLSEVAEHFHFSSGYLSLRFKEYTGTTFSQYVINKRLERSCELLSGTSTQIYKIAAQVGYTDEKHFTKLFIRYRSMNPRDYRMKHQNKDKSQS